MPSIDITYPADFDEKIKETIRTKIGIEFPAVTDREYAYLSDAEKRAYNYQLKIYRDWFSTLMYERQKGYRIGLRARVTELQASGLSMEEISKLTGQATVQLEHLLNTIDE